MEQLTAHRRFPPAALDAAVLAAYGFSAKKDLLAQLLALNLVIAAKIERNEPVTATDWRPLTYDFEVKDATGNDVEFVCDFKGTEGEAWFDASSLRVRRLRP